jgi:hypothetical protein
VPDGSVSLVGVTAFHVVEQVSPSGLSFPFRIRRTSTSRNQGARYRAPWCTAPTPHPAPFPCTDTASRSPPTLLQARRITPSAVGGTPSYPITSLLASTSSEADPR